MRNLFTRSTKTSMKSHFFSGKRLRNAGFAVFLLAGATGCDDLLSVKDPGAIQEDDLTNPATEQLIVNGALSEFQYAYDYMTLSASIFSDEIYTDHTNIDHREFALHDFRNTNAINTTTYTNLHKARAAGDDGVERLRGFHGDAANSNLNVAELLVIAGYSYTLLGEHFCESPIAGSAPLSSVQLLQTAVQRFDEAIAIAGRASSNPQRATELINTARVGAARASLQLGQMQAANGYASQVPFDFERWINRSMNSTREQAILGNQWASATGAWAGVGPRFQNLNDPRVRHTASPRPGLNARDVYLPYLPYSYRGWDASDADQTIMLNSEVRYASGLEARYIVAEASGANAQTLTFVNERRAVGGQQPVDLSGDALMAELREQRARDFFMAVQRHGDLRRYMALYGIDLFPQGKYPVTDEIYGNQRCFIIPLSEIGANPNL